MKEQRGFSIIELLIVLVLMTVIGFVAWFVLFRKQVTVNPQQRNGTRVLTEAQMRQEYDCDRITADSKATDVYCSDYAQYLSDIKNGVTLLGPNDFNDYYELILKRQIQRRDGCEAIRPSDNSYTDEFIICRVYVLLQDLPVSQKTKIEEVIDPKDYEFLQLNLNGTYREVTKGQYVITVIDRTILYDPKEDQILLDLEAVE